MIEVMQITITAIIMIIAEWIIIHFNGNNN